MNIEIKPLSQKSKIPIKTPIAMNDSAKIDISPETIETKQTTNNFETEVHTENNIKKVKKRNDFLENIEIKDSENIETSQKENGFYINKSMFHTILREKQKETNVKLSNFVMKSMFHLLDGSNNTLRIIFLQRNTGEKYFSEVLSSEMKPEAFETILKSKRCTFLGTSSDMKKIFNQMMDEEIQAERLNYLGWNEEFKIYVFADSIFTKDNEILTVDPLGIINENGDYYYLPAFSFANINSEDYKTDRLYKYVKGKADFKEWITLFYQSFNENAIIGVLYTVLSIYRDIVFYKVSFFPFLFEFGDAGTGKTSFTEILLSLFGTDTIGTPLNNSTAIALSRLCSSRVNSLFYFKEFTNETDTRAEDFILTAYDGAGRTTGVKTNDNKTKSLPIKSGLIFDGNHLPSQKSAILSRMILLNFEHSKFTDDQKSAYNKLTELKEYGFGGVLTELLNLREKIERNFSAKYKEVSRNIKNQFSSLTERNINHTALLYTMYEVISKEIFLPFSHDEAFRVIIENAEKLNSILNESSEISNFWQSFSFNFKNGSIKEYSEASNINKNSTHFRIKYETDTTKILQLKLDTFFPFYVKYCKDNNTRFLDKSSIKMLLTSSSNENFFPSPQKSRKSTYTDKKFGSCYQFWLTETDNGFEINNVEIYNK